MEIDLYDLLQADHILVVFTVIALGYLLGKIKFSGIGLGNVTGVLLVGLLFGSLGFTGSSELATFGFTIFIFCVGLQAGPGFFRTFARDGFSYLALSCVVALSAVSLAFFFSRYLLEGAGITVGVLAGSLTSTPMLVGAQDAVNSGLLNLPEGITSEHLIKNISAAYSLTYLFGVGSLLLVIRYLPRFFKIDLVQESGEVASSCASIKILNENNLPIVRTYKIVGPDLAGKTLDQVQDETGQYFIVLGLRRHGALLDVTRNTVMKEGDIISILASISQHDFAKKLAISEVFDQELLSFRIRTKEIVVTSSDYVGKTIQDLSLAAEYGCFALGLVRSGVELPVSQGAVLSKGDKLEVIGEESHIAVLAERLGRIEAEAEKTDLLTLCLGVALGLLLGTLVIKLGQISVGLGSAGGLLLVGILIGYLRSIYPTFGVFPRAARNIMMDLGIVLFMSSIGLAAGSKVLGLLAESGLILIVCGVSFAIIPVFVSFLVGRYLLKMNSALLLGAITGAMTSTPSLNMLTDMAKSQVPALGYAGTYTFSNVILTFLGALLVLL